MYVPGWNNHLFIVDQWVCTNATVKQNKLNTKKATHLLRVSILFEVKLLYLLKLWFVL